MYVPSIQASNADHGHWKKTSDYEKPSQHSVIRGSTLQVSFLDERMSNVESDGVKSLPMPVGKGTGRQRRMKSSWISAKNWAISGKLLV
jgi:hypothetical protein